jgi:hypothetical protein
MKTTQVNEKNFADTIKQGTVLLSSQAGALSAAAATGGV